MLSKLCSHVCCFHVFVFKSKKRSEEILSDLFPEELLGFAARVGAEVDLRVA